MQPVGRPNYTPENDFADIWEQKDPGNTPFSQQRQALKNVTKMTPESIEDNS